jgi:hypothetical protein
MTLEKQVSSNSNTPTLETKKQYLDDLVAFAARHDQLLYLKSRWLHERLYEEFADYDTAIKKIFTDAGHSVVKVSRSFTILVAKHGELFQVKIQANTVSGRILTASRAVGPMPAAAQKLEREIT